MRPSQWLPIIALLLLGCEQQVMKDKLFSRDRTIRLRSSIANPFGMEGLVTHKLAGEKLYSGWLTLTGVSWSREFIRWDNVQRRIEQWNWVETDRVVRLAEDAGLQVLPVLDRCAPWARRDPVNVLEDYEIQPPSPVHWAKYIREAVGRYKGSIRYWQIWDRPDDPSRFDGTPEDYVELLRTAYLKAREVDPGCVIVMGSVADAAWLDAVLSFGAANYCDIIAMDLPPGSAELKTAEDGRTLHIVSAENFDDEAELEIALARIEQFKRVVARHKANMPLWVTRVGKAAAPARAQARFLVKLHVSAIAGGVDAIFWSTFVSENDSNVSSGLLYPDMTPRLAAEAYHMLAQFLPDTSGRRAIADGNETVCVYEFEGLNESVMVVWGENGSVVELPAAYTEVYDMCGRPRRLSEEEEKTNTITLEGDPLFITAPITRAPTPAPSAAGQDSSF